MNEVEIKENQKSLEINRYDLDFYPKDDMPFYDYLDNCLGINRKDLPDEIKNIYRWKHSYIPEFSWVFNEMVYYSIEKDTGPHKIKIFDGKYIFTVDCQELRRLVILYGGEQDRNETNEK